MQALILKSSWRREFLSFCKIPFGFLADQLQSSIGPTGMSADSSDKQRVQLIHNLKNQCKLRQKKTILVNNKIELSIISSELGLRVASWRLHAIGNRQCTIATLFRLFAQRIAQILTLLYLDLLHNYCITISL